jgi:ubiquinone/menaquinone biosynthesis C-methylase UbiE
MRALAERLRTRFYGDDEHPYRIFQTEVANQLATGATLLDAGCGRTAPVLGRFRGRAARLIGVDLVDFRTDAEDLELYRGDLASIPVPDNCVDVVMARSVMEHVTQPREVYAEVFRVLRPGGASVFLTANLWDYASLVAKVVPNRFHPWIVARTEGRREEDVFPIAYRTNTRGAVRRFAAQAGFEVEAFRYLGQYPSYFLFNGFLFALATGYQKVISAIPALNFLDGWILATLRKPPSARPG